MSPLSWVGHDEYDHDDLTETGRLPAEEFGHIDFAEAFGVCVEQPSRRERLTHRAHRLAKSSGAAVTARSTTHEEDS